VGVTFLEVENFYFFLQYLKRKQNNNSSPSTTKIKLNPSKGAVPFTKAAIKNK
jgi:hypothetical protein